MSDTDRCFPDSVGASGPIAPCQLTRQKARVRGRKVISERLLGSAVLVLLATMVVIRHDSPGRQAILELSLLLSASAAVILGIIGVRRSVRIHGHGAGTAATLIAIGIFGLAAWLPLHNYFRHLRFNVRLRAVCADRLVTIGSNLKTYGGTHGQFPDRLSTLYHERRRGLPTPRCPARVDQITQSVTSQSVFDSAVDDPSNPSNSYVYCGSGVPYSTPGQTVLIYEKLTNHSNGINVLYADGHVEWLEGARAEALIRANSTGGGNEKEGSVTGTRAE